MKKLSTEGNIWMRDTQINLHHSKAASAALLLHLAENGADVALIQEPWIRGASEYRPCKADIGGKKRACILEKKNLNLFLLPNFSNEPNHVAVVIGALRLVEDSGKQKIDLIIGCDANAHHHQLGSTDMNERGKPPTRDVDSREDLDAMVDTPMAFNKAVPIADRAIRASKAFHLSSKANTETACEAYKADLRQYTKELRRAKRNAWTKFCLNSQQTSEASRLRKVLATNAPNVGIIKTSEGSWTTSSKETLKALAFSRHN
ncbi:uncharacterized protein [Drosophila bipectinata]|uniref:uncharacterized protein n=1 Tax=Drosophila bipectinata TaxID=42026 RepID=UPI0038B2F026